MGFKKSLLPKSPTVDSFIAKADIHDLTALSLDDLANQFDEIDQQSQLLKGLILRLQIDKKFGQWIVTSGLSASTTHQTRTVYMNLARFFKNRDMTGISLTAAYEISRPQNSSVTEEIYSHALLKNLPVTKVKEKITELKNQRGIASIVQNKKIELLALSDKLQTYKDAILDDVKDLSNQDAVRVLKLCLKELQEKKEI